MKSICVSQNGVPAQGKVLYEGNFAEWHDDIMALRKLPLMQRRRSYCNNIKRKAGHYMTKTQKECGVFLDDLVHHSVRVRIPDEAKVSARRLFDALRQVATPFRLLDLPAEVRIMIFEFSLRDEVVRIPCDTWEKYTPSPPISRTCRLFRQELLPVYYASTLFRFSAYSDTPCDLVGMMLCDKLREWAAAVGAEQIKHLRTLQLYAPASQSSGSWYWGRCSYHKIKLHFSVSKGLSISFDSHFMGRVMSLLRDHVHNRDVVRKAMGLQGESLIMAVIDRPELWNAENLEIEV